MHHVDQNDIEYSLFKLISVHKRFGLKEDNFHSSAKIQKNYIHFLNDKLDISQQTFDKIGYSYFYETESSNLLDDLYKECQDFYFLVNVDTYSLMKFFAPFFDYYVFEEKQRCVNK
jgi:hypothetical protein